jgi:hypothetical protein
MAVLASLDRLTQAFGPAPSIRAAVGTEINKTKSSVLDGLRRPRVIRQIAPAQSESAAFTQIADPMTASSLSAASTL